MGISLFDIQAQDAELAAEIGAGVQAVLDSGRFILGPEGTALEEELAALCSVSHGIGVGSGTDALILALVALGIGPGDEVITSPFTFGASAGTIAWLGATPVFADIDPHTLNLDPDWTREAITDRTRAIVPVHLFGLPAPMEELCEIAREHGLPVIEDAAQAIGATYQGRPVGSLADVACFSFYPTKNLGGYGDGGMVVTDDDELAGKIRLLQRHGSVRKYFHDIVGTNSRLDEIQACILRIKLRKLPDWTDARRQHADVYRRLLADADGLELPGEPEGSRHVYHLFTIQVGDPGGLAAELGRREIGTGRYYPAPLHLMPAFAGSNRPGGFPVAEEASRRCLSIPVHPALSREQVERVAREVRALVAGVGQVGGQG